MMFSSMISISFIFIFIKHLLFLGFLILMYTTLISLTLTSIASNDKFKTNIFLFLKMSMIFSNTMVYKNVNNSFWNEFWIKFMLTNQMKYLNNFYSMKKFNFSPLLNFL